MSPKVSFIVPIYNTEHDLRRCLDSIRGQSYTDWDCLLIDDGSTDRSGSICDEYEKSDNRFKAFHKQNEGEGKTRNFGLDHADGEFIAFVDSDDWIEADYLEFLISKVHSGVDMVMCHAIFEYPNASVEVLKITPGEIICTEGNKADYILSSISKGYAKNVLHEEHGFLNTVWGKIYRRSVIEQNNLRFCGLRLNVDAVFNLYFYQYAEGFRIFSKIMYHYFMRASSAVHSFKKNHIAIYNEYLGEVRKFIELHYEFKGDFERSYNSLVITSLFNITKDYFYNPKYESELGKKAEMKNLIVSSPYKSAIKTFDGSLSKNREVSFVAYAYKLKMLWLLDVYFRLRPKMKSLVIAMRGNNR